MLKLLPAAVGEKPADLCHEEGHHQGFIQRLVPGALQDLQEAISTVSPSLMGIASLLPLSAEHLWLQGLPVRIQHSQDVLAGQLEDLVEVASAAAQAFQVHPVGILQDLHAEGVFRGADQLHGLLNHRKLTQAQPGSGLCANIAQRLLDAFFSPSVNVLLAVTLWVFCGLQFSRRR